jgi:DNA-directed RNA polymerase subunit RPC12/RpoP
VSITWPTAETRWRCSQCGNLTRFDVVRSSRVKEFVHLDLAGEPTVEETEVLAETIDEVRCRWCGSAGTIEMVPRPSIEAEASRSE